MYEHKLWVIVMKWCPFILKTEAELDSYRYFDKLVRKLPRTKNGDFNSALFGDNDVDAFRHSYVSGVFVHEYGSTIANILGIANELITFAYNSPNTVKSRNMDLWNNAVGRKYGLKTRKTHTLAKKLVKALKNGELITDLQDSRQFSMTFSYKVDDQKPVIVLKKSRTGRNEGFFDLSINQSMSRDEFVSNIQDGKYPGYRIANYRGIKTPVSKRDGKSKTNLG